MKLTAISSLFTASNVAFCALLISVIALFVAIYAVIRLLQNEHNSPNYSPQKYNKIEEQQIRYHIDQQVKKQFESSQEKIVDEVVEKVRYCQKLDEKEKKEDEANLATRFVNMGGKTTAQPVVTVQPHEVANMLYATAVGESDDTTFCCVETAPQKDTIFLFREIQKGKCEFEVYEGAYSRVLKVSEYIKGACSLDKIGNSKVVTAQKGIAELNVEGKWVVKTKAKVIFE